MNTRFAVAVHVLSFLANERGEPATSEHIAGSVNTHASLIRRMLSLLANSGFTRSVPGAGGGTVLARPADEITLRDVFLAVADRREFIPMHRAPNPQCLVGRHITTVLEEHVDAAHRALLSRLAETTIADLTSTMVRRESRSRRSANRS